MVFILDNVGAANVWSIVHFIVTSPEAVRQLIQKAGLEVVLEMPRDASNVYYNRDYCVIVQKEA